MNGSLTSAFRAVLLSLTALLVVCGVLLVDRDSGRLAALEIAAHSESESVVDEQIQLVPAAPDREGTGQQTHPQRMSGLVQETKLADRPSQTARAHLASDSATPPTVHQDLERPNPPRHTTVEKRSMVYIEAPAPIEKRTQASAVRLERRIEEFPSHEAGPASTFSDSTREPSGVDTRLAGIERRVLALAQQQDQSSQIQQATDLLRQLQQSDQLQNLKRQLELIKAGKDVAPATSTPAEQDERTTSSPPPPRDPVLKAKPSEGQPESFSLQIQDADISEVLDMLGQLSGLNILVGTGVSGKVTANLENVTIDEALHAILRSLGFVFQKEGNFIFVLTSTDAEARKKLERKIVTKVYRPNYISVADLKELITPLMTETIGKMAVTKPPEMGISTDSEKAGADNITQQDALLVQDYAEVIEEIDGVVDEMDVPPAQVVIEAMIMSVTLDDDMEFGVNFALLNNSLDNLGVIGNGNALNVSNALPDGTNAALVPAAGQFLADTAGLKYGAISENAGAFINALETIADTNLVASPQLRVLNKQKAQLIIGDRISYKTLAFNGTQTVEEVSFLDSGTKLLFRPYIAPDGLIRMAIHPERSSAVIDPLTGLPNQKTTEVTTNVMVRDGHTIVIGGLIEEQVSENYQRVPLLGALPLIGPAFRSKTEEVNRTELIVLITPRIVHAPEDAATGETIRLENERRADNFRNNLTRMNRRNLARIEYEKAQDYFEADRLLKARTHVNLAMRHSKNNKDILALRDQIEGAISERTTGWLPLPGPRDLHTRPSGEFQEAAPSETKRSSFMRLPSLRKR